MIDSTTAMKALAAALLLAMAAFGTYVLTQAGEIYEGGAQKIEETKAELDSQAAQLQALMDEAR